MTAEAIAVHLGARRSGAGWVARCPAHDDRKPSLSISEGRDGRVLVFCHAGCSFEAIREALAQQHDIHLDGGGDHRQVPSHTATYTDAGGSPLYQVRRWDEAGNKRIFQYGWDPDRCDWMVGLNGVPRTLYHLDDVVVARYVFLVEGERKCDRLRAALIAAGKSDWAVTTTGGAKTWRSELAPNFTAKGLVLLADNDVPGRAYVDQIARDCRPFAAKLRIVDLPGLAEGGDIEDWLNAANAVGDLFKLIKTTEEWQSPHMLSPAHSGFVLTPIGELLARPDQPLDYVWDKRLTRGSISLCVGKPKAGKTTFARNLALEVSRGKDFLGQSTKQGDVIYLALEEREEDVKADFRALGATANDPLFVHADATPEAGILALIELVRTRLPVLVIIDPLIRLARIKDEKAYAEVYTALGPLIDLAREVGTHILLLHHAGKSLKADAIDVPLGSTALGGAPAALIVIRRSEAYRTIQTVQRRGEDLDETVLVFDAATKRLTLGGTRAEADRHRAENGIVDCLKNAGSPQNQTQIRDGVEGKTRSIRAALTSLMTAGKVKRSGSGTKGDPFVYEFPVPGSPHSAGTGEPESQNPDPAPVNTGEILVPVTGADPILVPAGNDEHGGTATDDGDCGWEDTF